MTAMSAAIIDSISAENPASSCAASTTSPKRKRERLGRRFRAGCDERQVPTGWKLLDHEITLRRSFVLDKTATGPRILAALPRVKTL